MFLLPSLIWGQPFRVAYGQTQLGLTSLFSVRPLVNSPHPVSVVAAAGFEPATKGL